ncbi:MAG TPA: FAD-dependent oxidoreductase [Gaiellaceae bacterium]|nr:FAD-dependent oxidoreductase [Gaiellaceae bacterium]
MKATIKEKREVAKGTLFVTFDLGGENVEFEPGQYFWVELLDPPYEDEKGPRRHITVVTSPTEGVLGLATRIRDTAFKRSLVEMPEGASVDVEQPKGSFVLPEDTSKRYAFVAGGIGITPFRSMLRYIADNGLDYDITLVYSNRDVESTAFLNELKEFESVVPRCRVLFTMTDDPSWEGDKRMLDAEVLRELLGDLESFHFMIAGPPPMAKSVEASLLEAGLSEDQVQSDSFSGY